jgi:hypothetical protein
MGTHQRARKQEGVGWAPAGKEEEEEGWEGSEGREEEGGWQDQCLRAWKYSGADSSQYQANESTWILS